MHKVLVDWVLLLALVAMWGSSFMFNKRGLETVTPLALVAARLAVGALVLLIVVHARGMRLPQIGPVWAAYTAMGFVGNALPFFLITWGQQAIDSALAGILIAAMPLATLLLAHFIIAGEHLTQRRAAGFLVGFAGILVLMGPAVATRSRGSTLQVVSELAVLGGALCYSTNSILARLS